MDPDSVSMALGRSDLRMKFPVAALAGHSCHCTSPGETVWPMLISALATRTSTVAIWITGAVFTCGGFSERPASMAATPPAATATVSTTRRAAFIRFTLTVAWRPARPRNRHGGQCDRLHRISTAKRQGMVKQRYLNRVNIVLRPLLGGVKARSPPFAGG